MIEKASAAGWVVQVTIPAPHASPSETGVKWIGRAWPSAPSFQYYNVAIATPEGATEAATAYHARATADAAVDNTRVVRELSPAEIGVLRLSAGEVRAA
jgi:hypothetical protein